MPGSGAAGDLAQRRQFTLASGEVIKTPILLPSFSSKGFPQIKQIFETTSETIDGAVLVSAFDIHYKHLDGPFSFSPLVFLDSGGYEAGADTELSETRVVERPGLNWSQDQHNAVVNSWKPDTQSVLISYDHPEEREKLAAQIARAQSLIGRRPDAIPEFLIKPESSGQTRLRLVEIQPHVHSLSQFPIIGVTEKEIGNSLLTRMENIARLRFMLSAAGLSTPIHVFGSLDTLSTTLYFLCGADIFDGLTWLRFAYYEGHTLYKHNFGALMLGPEQNSDVVEAYSWAHNYRYMRNMELQMIKYLRERSFENCFDHNASLLRKTYETALAKLED